MTDTPLPIYGDFAFDPETRRLKGMLVPFGEKSRPTQTGHVATFVTDTLDLPRDASVVSLNRRHDKYDPVGRAVVLEKQDKGVYAEFQLADTDEADAWLKDERESLRKLSPEVQFEPGYKRARLTGAALVEEGAFASAGLFSVAPVEALVEIEAHIDAAADALGALTPDPSETPEANPEKKEDIVSDVIIPDGVQVETPDKKADTSLGALFAAMSYAKKSGDTSILTPFQGGNVDFAIASIQDSGPSGKTIGLDTAQPAYLGELWSRLTYVRKYWSLVSNAPLNSYKVVGWRWTAPPEVAAYAGNNTEVPSNAVDTEPVTADARRIAGGHRLDRRFRDFNDQEVIESYFRLMTESYARVSDADILAKIVGAATTTAPGAVPSGIPKGLAALVDGALDVVAQENTPTFAIISPELMRDILMMGKDDVFAYLSFAFGLKGEGSGEGFQIRTGNVGTGKVIVGAKEAMTAFELPGSPIRVEAVAPHHGAFDEALYGYIADVVHNAAAIRSVTVASA